MAITGLTETTSLTEKANRLLTDLIEENIHPLPCECGSCLYSVYLTGPKKKSGRPYKKLLFFLSFLIHEAKLDHLAKQGKVKKIFYWGRERLITEPGEYDKALFIEKTGLILSELKEKAKSPEIKAAIELLIHYFERYYRRADTQNFLSLIEDLRNDRLSEWLKTNRENLTAKDIKLAKRVSDFVRLRREVPRHDILRRFTIKKDALDRINVLLRVQGILSEPIKPKRRMEGKEAKRILYFFRPPDK